MTRKRICQFSTGFNPGDAISQEMIAFDSYFKSVGWDSEIYAEHIGAAVKKVAIKFKKYSPKLHDIIIYHHSIHSNVLDFLIQQPGKKILIYHNVTPAFFYEPYDLQFSYLLSEGKKELVDVRNKFTASLADSEFNKMELLDMGYKNVNVLPIVYDFSGLDEQMVIRHKFDGIKIIFVGRISPNKKQDDLIRFAEIYRKYFRQDFQIQLIGYASQASKKYQEELEQLVRLWELEEHIHFSGYVTQSELNGYYKNADIFLSMSEHEGFCVPLLEAMHSQIPIFAFNAGAVKDTLNGSGILFNTKNYPHLAETIEEVLSNPKFRNSIIKRQNQRLAEYSNSGFHEILGRTIQNIEN